MSFYNLYGPVIMALNGIIFQKIIYPFLNIYQIIQAHSIKVNYNLSEENKMMVNKVMYIQVIFITRI